MAKQEDIAAPVSDLTPTPESEVPKEQAHLRPVPVEPVPEPLPSAIEGELAKLVTDLAGIDTARNAVEQRGIQYANQAQQLLIENEDRVAEVDRAINAEEDLIGKCDRGIEQLQAMVKEHGSNLAMLKIEKQTRLNTIHGLKSANVTA